MRPVLCILFLLLLIKAGAQAPEPWRPAFHFTPPANWMNDPNGLVYHNGTYHLFYQYYPDSTVWGPMHWGHATSPDLFHWTHQPIALYPDSLGWIFSGSAVIDKNNTAGFGKDAMVAIFTYHNDAIWKAGRKNTESQGIAFSLDEGLTWTKYPGNPVLNNSGEQDFRDPKVSWHAARKCWIMVLAAGDRIKMYSSVNLTSWKFESDFVPDVKEPYGVWECPDLFPMKSGNEEKWVLILSQNMNGPNGGSATRYIVGSFDGMNFRAETTPRWIDHGTDYYAAVTYDNAPGGKRILLGWMSNWMYAEKTPTKEWRSAMALPRELSLIRSASGYRLSQSIISSLDGQTQPLVNVNSADKVERADLDFSRAIIAFDIAAGNAPIVVELSNDSGEKTSLRVTDYDMQIDRGLSGLVDFSKDFAGKPQLLKSEEKITRLEMYLDASSLEVSLNHGAYWMTVQYFPRKSYHRLSVSGRTVKHLDLRRIDRK